jgi:hypothetical protein
MVERRVQVPSLQACCCSQGIEKRTRDSTSCDASREGGAELMSKKSRGRKTGRNYFHCGLETRIVYDHKLMKD